MPAQHIQVHQTDHHSIPPTDSPLTRHTPLTHHPLVMHAAYGILIEWFLQLVQYNSSECLSDACNLARGRTSVDDRRSQLGWRNGSLLEVVGGKYCENS